MPFQRSRQPYPFSGDKVHRFIIALSMVGAISAPAATARAVSSQPIAIRSRSVELHYRLTGAGPSAQVELWYTRDRATTWHQANIDDNHQRPITFLAPAEGLYGFTLIVRDNDRISQPPPQAHELPQRWVLIDYTPPLAQWNFP